MGWNEKKIVREIFELAWGCPKVKFHIFLCFSSFFKFKLLTADKMERTPDGAVWAAFLCPREMAKLNGLIWDLRLPLQQG